MIEISVMLNNGLGLKKNPQEAEKFLMRAVESGSIVGMYNLGFVYETGGFGFKNEKKALKYYKMALNNGDIPSFYRVALMTMDGRGCEPNFEKAIRLLKYAASKGDNESIALLKKLKSQGKY